MRPRPKGRPRFRVIGKHVSTYTDKETREYEEAVKQAWIAAHGESVFDGPVTAIMAFWFKRPKSHYTASGALKVTAPGAEHIQRPDLDNIEKAILDGLNDVAFADDKLVWAKTTMKRWSTSDQIEITLMGVDDAH